MRIEATTGAEDARRLRSVPAEGFDALCTGARTTPWSWSATSGSGSSPTRTAEPVGDFTFLRLPEGPRPVEGGVAEESVGDTEFGKQIFALDERTWAVPTPMAAAMTRVRAKPVMRETMVPAAMRALDLARGAGAGGDVGADSCWWGTPGEVAQGERLLVMPVGSRQDPSCALYCRSA
ncbi:hypothetical protein ACIBLA_22750 [Streptomyces sp. NPDC050433]|uniref:hypothetical protein n=1 Tax=Streptomyces sp. NPDC050433 TaxID=3365615 RepID=UPI0037B29ED7